MGRRSKQKKGQAVPLMSIKTSNPGQFNAFRNDHAQVGKNLCNVDFFLQDIQREPTLYNMLQNPHINNWVTSSPLGGSLLLTPPPPMLWPGVTPQLMSISPSSIFPVVTQNGNSIDNQNIKSGIPLNNPSNLKVQPKESTPAPVQVQNGIDLEPDESYHKTSLMVRANVILDRLTSPLTKLNEVYRDFLILKSDFDLNQHPRRVATLTSVFFEKAVSHPILGTLLACLLRKVANSFPDPNQLHAETIKECHRVIEATIQKPAGQRSVDDRISKFRFIGELYNYDILTAQIVQCWMQILMENQCRLPLDRLNPKMRETYVFMCVVLKTVGKKLDSELQTFELEGEMTKLNFGEKVMEIQPQLGFMNKLFEHLEERLNPSEMTRYDAYILSLMNDLIQFRKNGWKYPSDPDPESINIRSTTDFPALKSTIATTKDSKHITDKTDVKQNGVTENPSRSEDIEGEISYRCFRPATSVIRRRNHPRNT